MDAATRPLWAPEVASRSFVAVAALRSRRRPAGAFPWLDSALIAGLLLTAVVVSVLRGLPPPRRIDAGAFGRVGQGMDRGAVEKAIGLPAGDYRDRAHRPGGRAFTEWSEEVAGEEFGGAAEERLQWQGNEYSISAGFDETGRVAWKTLWRHVPAEPRGPADQVQRRLGW